jgi:cytochrome c oxidase assembly protein subunit 15
MTSSPESRSHVLPVAFGTTVAMWAAAYVCRLPVVNAPSAVVLACTLACLLAGGFVAGRYGRRGFRDGLLPSLLSSILNMLVLGSLLSGKEPNSVVPTALLWIPGSILAAVALGSLGATIGARFPANAPMHGTAAFARVATVATFFLLIVGGVVTSNDAGLAVADWPNSYGYNMFLYPLSRMTGGIYYEHAHRLFGSLVGLTTLVLAVILARAEERAWVRRLGWTALALVITQGILGGLRVTGRFTMGADTEPKIALAVVHGITAQVFFAVLVSLSVFTSEAWKAPERSIPTRRSSSGRALGAVLLGCVLAQLVLGALVRHLSLALYPHAVFGIVVAILAILAGAKAASDDRRVVRRTGTALIVVTLCQVALGIGALLVTRILPQGPQPRALDIVVTTAHQGSGALLLGCAVALFLWKERAAGPVGTEEILSARSPGSTALA